MNIKGVERKVYFVLLGLLSDNLSINTFMGYATSFSSMYYCRFCKLDKKAAQTQIQLHRELNRTKSNYEEDLNKPFKETGIKENSESNRLKYYHAEESCVVDVMHDLFSHGICAYDFAAVLNYMIKTLKISLHTINYRIKKFKYGESEKQHSLKKNKKNHIRTASFKMTAKDMLRFVRYFPLIFGDLVPQNNEVWNFVLSLVELVDLVMLPSFNEHLLKILEEQIIYHHTLYTQLFNEKLKPKYHILLHYVQTIRKLGPPRYTWSFRFEAFHQIFKKYCRNITSRRNICLTLCTKASLIFSNNLNNANFFGIDLTYKNAVTVKLINMPYFALLDIDSNIHLHNFQASNNVSYKGVEYKIGYFLSKSSRRLSNIELYEIRDILIKNDDLYFVCRKWRISNYSEHYAAFEVTGPCDMYKIAEVNEFDGPPIHLYSIENKLYIRLKKYFI
ncbi:uncharacterized protein LOC129733225 [Wyeomyia smithii]|uniref:uncharacterized protein LOC129733225 n=1 Tax=Wyeomyia smithii TaxID=174621 RepID=UPI0024681BE8|nr:uncharacterized protein LOC129733225 [Wyeomyia smithii]